MPPRFARPPDEYAEKENEMLRKLSEILAETDKDNSSEGSDLTNSGAKPFLQDIIVSEVEGINQTDPKKPAGKINETYAKKKDKPVKKNSLVAQKQ